MAELTNSESEAPRGGAAAARLSVDVRCIVTDGSVVAVAAQGELAGKILEATVGSLRNSPLASTRSSPSCPTIDPISALHDTVSGLHSTVSELETEVSELRTELSGFNAASALAGEAAGIRSAAELLERAILGHHKAALSALLPRDIRSSLFHLLKRLRKQGSGESLALAERIRETAAVYGLNEEGIRALLLLREVTSPIVHVKRPFASAAEVKAAIGRAFDADRELQALLASDVDLWFPAYERARVSAGPSP